MLALRRDESLDEQLGIVHLLVRAEEQHRPHALRCAQPRDHGAIGANGGLATGQPQVVPVDLRVGAVPRDPRLVESAQSELVGDVEVGVGAAHQPHEVAAAVARQ